LGIQYPLDEHSNAILSFTQRLYQFPLGVFGIAVATAIFPMLSRHADEPRHFTQTLRRGCGSRSSSGCLHRWGSSW